MKTLRLAISACAVIATIGMAWHFMHNEHYLAVGLPIACLLAVVFYLIQKDDRRQ